MSAARHTAGIPIAIPERAGTISVRGELYISRANFAELNAERETAGESHFATPRNAAAGSVRLLEGWGNRRLSFVAFELIEVRTPDGDDLAAASAREGRDSTEAVPQPPRACTTQWDALRRLQEFGFATVVPVATQAESLDSAIVAGQEMLDGRDELEFETDGCVLKVNSLQVRIQLPHVSTCKVLRKLMAASRRRCRCTCGRCTDNRRVNLCDAGAPLRAGAAAARVGQLGSEVRGGVEADAAGGDHHADGDRRRHRPQRCARYLPAGCESRVEVSAGERLHSGSSATTLRGSSAMFMSALCSIARRARDAAPLTYGGLLGFGDTGAAQIDSVSDDSGQASMWLLTDTGRTNIDSHVDYHSRGLTSYHDTLAEECTYTGVLHVSPFPPRRLAGIVVPVALLDPVQIAGVTVKRASLHNTDHVASLDLRIGDVVVVQRRGDVIPQISEVLHQKRPRGAKPWVPPDACPACGCKLELRTPGKQGETTTAAKGVPVLACGNEGCVGRQGRLLQHFASTCIKGLGKRMVEEFSAKGLITTPVDIYSLHDKREQVRVVACGVQCTSQRFEPICKQIKVKLLAAQVLSTHGRSREGALQIKQLPKFGDKKVDNLLAAIEKSREGKAAVLLSALGIPSVGERMATVLLQRFGTIPVRAYIYIPRCVMPVMQPLPWIT